MQEKPSEYPVKAIGDTKKAIFHVPMAPTFPCHCVLKCVQYKPRLCKNNNNTRHKLWKMREIKNNSKSYCTFKTRVLIYSQQMKHAKKHTNKTIKHAKAKKEKHRNYRSCTAGCLWAVYGAFVDSFRKFFWKSDRN